MKYIILPKYRKRKFDKIAKNKSLKKSMSFDLVANSISTG